MNKFIFALIGLLCVSSFVMAQDVDDSAVTVLTEGNFDTLVKSSNPDSKWFIMFYAPWCGHCKRAKPEYAKFAQSMKGEVNVAKVDCTENGGLCERFGVQGYPTFKFVQGDKFFDYRGPRTTDAWTAFATDGHKSAQSEVIPGPLTQLESIQKKFEQVLQQFVQLYHREPTMFAGLVGGMVLICLLSVYCTSKMADSMETKASSTEERSRTTESGDKAARSASKDKKKVKRE